MSQNGDQYSGSQDADEAIARQMRSQLQSTISHTAPSITQKHSENADPSLQQSTGSSKDGFSFFEIIVPKIQNSEDYGYLPGHFEVHSILAVDMHEPKVIVRLKSGERSIVC